MHECSLKSKLAGFLAVALVAAVAWVGMMLIAVWIAMPADTAQGIAAAPLVPVLLLFAALFGAYRLGGLLAGGAPAAPAPADKELARREWEYRTLAENSPDNIARYDRDCRILYINPQMEKTKGIPASEMLGRRPWEIGRACTEDVEGFKALVGTVFATAEPAEIEVTIGDNADNMQYHQIRFVAERDDDGNVISVLGIGRDITPQRIAEKRQEYERNILRTFFRAMPDMAWIKDMQGRYLACNPVFEQFCGFAEADLLGKTDFAFADFELATFFRRKDEEAIAAGKPCTNEEWVTFADDGRRALLETVKMPIHDAAGRPIGVLGIAHDITDRRRTEEALLDSRRTLQEAQRIAHIGSWRLEIADDRMEWSDETFRIFELDPEKIRASCEAYQALVHPEDRERLHRYYADALAKGTPCDYEHRLLMPDGRIKHVHGRCETEFAADGTPSRSIGTIQDVTTERETALRLEQSRIRLQELAAHREEVREEERRRIARDLHEELGQLLTSLRMRLSVLRVRFGSEHADVLDLLPPMLSLVDQSLDSLRNTVADLRPTPLDMGIVPALEWLASDFGKHTGIECLFFHTDESIDLPDDRATALFRIVQEALTNVARHAGASRADILLERTGDGLQLCVKDNGRGIPPQAARPKSFGLAGMWERSMMLGGELDIRTVPDCGTEVVLRFPA